MRKVVGAGAASHVGVRLLLLAAAACLVFSFGFAVMSTRPAAAHSPLSRTVANVDASNATACPNETVAVFGKPTILRFVLHGVSCRRAHRLIRTYFHDATVQSCRSRGNICAFSFSGGWTCSLPLYAGEGGGDFAGCWRSQSEHLRVFRVTRPRPAAGASSARVYFFPKYGYGRAPFPGVTKPDRVLVGITQPNPGFAVGLHWRGWGGPRAVGRGRLEFKGEPGSHPITIVASDRRTTIVEQCGSRHRAQYYARVTAHTSSATINGNIGGNFARKPGPLPCAPGMHGLDL
jgi:hypothetical protein